MEASIDRALSQGDTLPERPTEFMENLHPHDQGVSPVLRFIKAHLSQGLDDEEWYEEQLVFLLERMRGHQTQIHEHVEGLRLVRPTTRREIFRRVRLATDFLHTQLRAVVGSGMRSPRWRTCPSITSCDSSLSSTA